MRAPVRNALAALLVASVALAQPARMTCGPGGAGCGPASAKVPGAATTTPAPSWIPATVAAWMLDEASGTRANAQGTTALNLALGSAAVGNDTVNKMQGAAAMASVDATTYLQVSNAVFDNLTLNPFSFGCWLRGAPAGTGQRVIGHWGATHGYLIGPDIPGLYFYFQDTGGLILAHWTGYTANTFVHAVGTFTRPTIKLYANGALIESATSAGAAGTEAVQFHLGDNSTFPFPGQIDECFVIAKELTAASVCRICSCGLDGGLCTCQGTAFATKGRNATNCGACTLPSDCTATTPP